MNFEQLIYDFKKSTGDSPTHILVLPSQYDGENTFETSHGDLVDVLQISGQCTNSFPQFPMCVTLPQTTGVKVFKIKEYEVSFLEKMVEFVSDHSIWVFIGILILISLLGAVLLIHG